MKNVFLSDYKLMGYDWFVEGRLMLRFSDVQMVFADVQRMRGL